MGLTTVGIFIIAVLGFCMLIGFEIRIVTYLRQMKDLLSEIAKKDHV